jgi:hypothetical protein
MAAPKQFSGTAKEVYEYVAGLGLTDPQAVIDAVVRVYAGKYGITDQPTVATLSQLITRVGEWESGLENIKAKTPGEESYGWFQNNIEKGRGTGYTAEQMLDPITNTILAVEELLPIGQKALQAGGVPEAARALVVEGQRPDPKGNIQGMINYVAGQEVPTGTVTAQGVGNEGAYAGAGGGGTEEVQPWTDAEIIAFTAAGLSDAEAEDAEMLKDAGYLPGPTYIDAYKQYGELLRRADEAGVSVGDVVTMLTTAAPPVPGATPDVIMAQRGDNFRRTLDTLGLKGLEATAQRVGLTGPQLQQAIALGLTEDDIAVARTNGWNLDYAAKLRDQATQKGMSLSQAIANGYINDIMERQRLTDLGGGDIQKGIELENRQFREGETLEDYTRRRLIQGSSPDEIQRSIEAQAGYEAYREMMYAPGRLPVVGSYPGQKPGTARTGPGGPPQAAGFEWAGKPGGMLGLSEVGAMLTGQRMAEKFLGTQGPLGTQTQAEWEAQRQAMTAANPPLARRIGLLPSIQRPQTTAPAAVPPTAPTPAYTLRPGSPLAAAKGFFERHAPSVPAPAAAPIVPLPQPTTMKEWVARLGARAVGEAYAPKKKKTQTGLAIAR